MRAALNRLWAAILAEYNSLRRDTVAPFFIFVLPVGLVLILGLAFGSAGESVPVGILDESRSEASSSLVAALAEDEAIDVELYDSHDDLTDAVVRQDVTFGVVVPGDHAEQIAGGEEVSVTVVSAAGGADFALVQSSVGAALSEQVVVATAARVAADVTGAPEAAAAEIATLVASRATLAGVRSETVEGDVVVGGFERTAFTTLVLFLVITGLTSAGTITELRRNHVAQRLLVVPAPTPELEVGLVSARFVTILVQALYIVLFTAWLFGVDWGTSGRRRS